MLTVGLWFSYLSSRRSLQVLSLRGKGFFEIWYFEWEPWNSLSSFVTIILNSYFHWYAAQNGEKLKVKLLAFSCKIFVSLKQYFHPPWWLLMHVMWGGEERRGGSKHYYPATNRPWRTLIKHGASVKTLRSHRSPHLLHTNTSPDPTHHNKTQTWLSHFLMN